MTAAPEELPLAAGFAPADRERWHALVAAALRKTGRLAPDAPDAQAEELLTHLTDDGVPVRPLYTADDALADPGYPGAWPYLRGGRAEAGLAGGWDVRQRHADPDPAVTREAIRTDLAGGATSLWLVLGDAGIPLPALAEVLTDVRLDLAPVVLDAGEQAVPAALAYLDLLAHREVDPAQVRGSLGLDPFGTRARTGREQPVEPVVELARRVASEFGGLRSVTVDATCFHEAGASDAQELILSLASGVATLRALVAGGLDVATAAGQLEFRYAATADQFATIAKLRAARRLWARVIQASGAPQAAGQRQHAVTSRAMTTVRDPWVNILRGTLAAFAAGVGGADAVTVHPFDVELGLPDDSSRRIARNTSVLLLSESHLGRVIDPAGGSWYVEQRSDALARVVWEMFTEFERSGGFTEVLESGQVAGWIEAIAKTRAWGVARRRTPLTGVSEFPALDETLPVRQPAPQPAAPESNGLPVRRYAADFEALRAASDAYLAKHGRRPSVFLATLGPVAVHTARATFAANLFQAGGLATPEAGPATDAAQVVEAFRASGARVACLASSDRLYAELAAPVAKALVTAGARYVWLAGPAGDRGETDAAAGVDDYLSAGCDALAVLREAHRIVEVSR